MVIYLIGYSVGLGVGLWLILLVYMFVVYLFVSAFDLFYGCLFALMFFSVVWVAVYCWFLFALLCYRFGYFIVVIWLVCGCSFGVVFICCWLICDIVIVLPNSYFCCFKLLLFSSLLLLFNFDFVLITSVGGLLLLKICFCCFNFCLD